MSTLNFLHFQNNSCSWNSASKYLLKVKDGGNMVKFRVASEGILIKLFTLFLLCLMLTVDHVTTCFLCFCCWL